MIAFSDFLLAKVQCSNDRTVTGDILLLEVIKEVTPLSYQTDQRPAGAVIILVGLQMFGQMVDAIGKQGYLSFSTTRVLFIFAILAKNFFLFFS